MLIALREQHQALAAWVVRVDTNPKNHPERFGHSIIVKGDAIVVAPTPAAYNFPQTFTIIAFEKGVLFPYKQDRVLEVYLCVHSGRMTP